MACHGNSVNNTNAMSTKKFFERPSDAYVSTVKLSIEVAVQDLGGVHSTPLPLGQGVDKNALGRRGLTL